MAAVPRGFVRFVCVGSDLELDVRVESIAAYGPEQFDAGEFCGCPVVLRGQPRSEAIVVWSRLREIARMCINEIGGA